MKTIDVRRLLLGCSIGASVGCGALFAPDAETRVYTLTSIAGVPIESLPNIWLLCAQAYAAEGAEWAMLSDSILLYPGGRGEARNTARFRYSVPERGTSGRPDTSYLSPHQQEIQWRLSAERGDLRLALSYGRGWITYELDRDGSYSYDGTCGAWRYERGPSLPAP